jgi:GT2 family glycosyltransferase
VSSVPRVHVAVVNWNTAPAALESVAAYRASRSVKLTLVDNASAPEVQLRLRRGVEDDLDVELQLEPRNLGYGAAANRALHATEAELVCISNADVVPDPDMLRHLTAAALGDLSLALLAPRLHGPGGYHARLPKGYTLPLRAFAGSLGHRAVNATSSSARRWPTTPAGSRSP